MIPCLAHPNREATMIALERSPENWCDLCWELWFTSADSKYFAKEELIEIREKNLKSKWKEFWSPGKEQEKEMLAEMREFTEKEYDTVACKNK